MTNIVENGEVTIVASHKYTLSSNKNSDGSIYTVAKYALKDTGKQFTFKGINLPTTRDVEVKFTGTYTTDKYGPSFKVTSFEILLPTSEKGIVSYLTSLKVGIGKGRAKSAYSLFKESIWQVLENTPEELLKVPGITKSILEKLKKKLVDTKLERELAILFAGIITISSKKVNTLKAAYGEDIVNDIKNNPYSLCSISGFSFETVEKLGRKLNIPPNAPERLKASIKYVLDSYASKGHTCIPKNDLKISMKKELNRDYDRDTVTDKEIAYSLNSAWKEEYIKITGDMVYSRFRYEQEETVSNEIRRLLMYQSDPITNTEVFIDEYEKSAGITLAESQRTAVINSFKNKVNIITGGPGTGKTTIIKALLYVHKNVFGKASNPLLMAPTGRAARRMTEATGYPACTIHSAISFTGEERDSYTDEDEIRLDHNLFILDEASMIDLYITSVLLKKIPDDARIIIVGDPDQLPSVGCGNVLYDMIESGVVPVSKLNVIFRQESTNPIVANSAKIRDGNKNLEFTNSFCKYEERDLLGVFVRACKLYLASIKAFGVDNVILINPRRDGSEITVDKFNRHLQHYINPGKESDITIFKNSQLSFRANDRVMQMKNTEFAKNGDVGVIKSITEEPDENDPLIKVKTAFIEFNGDGNEIAYTEEMIQDLDLAYCTTVHKSQGSEYHTVIMIVSSEHSGMLKRNLIYTGVTRARKNVAIITESGSEALNRAIENNKQDKRYSLLSDRIKGLV